MNGNTVCKQLSSTGGAGAYISGYSVLFHPMKAFATIGGMGYFYQKKMLIIINLLVYLA